MRYFLTICLVCICMGFMNASCASVEEGSRLDSLPHSSLSLDPKQPALHLHAFMNPPVFHDLKEFSIEVFVENIGDRPVTIFPSLFQMEFRPLERGRVSYNPVEQEPVSVWEEAFVLKSEEVRKIKYVDLDGKNGRWALERGSYGLSVRYFVENEQLPMDRVIEKREVFEKSHVWVGDLQSKEVTIHYVPKGKKAFPLSMNR